MPLSSQIPVHAETVLANGLPAELGRELPHMHDAVTRRLLGWAMSWARRRILSIEGIHHLDPARDPYVLVANHSQRAEAVLLPALVVALRGGEMVHFMADWPMMLVPGLGFIYRRGQVIPVFGKSAKPAFLNVFKRFYQRPGMGSASERAGALLRQGSSVGIFPEGTMNRDPHRLLRGRTSAARLALENQVSVVPVGLRFPAVVDRPISDADAMSVHIGAPISPPSEGSDRGQVKAFHAQIMGQVSTLSGKAWNPDHPRDKRRR